MLKFNVLILLLALALIVTFGQAQRQQRRPFLPPSRLYSPGNRLELPFFGVPATTYKLCTYTSEAHDKCQETVKAAEDDLVALPLECVMKDSREECLRAVRGHQANMVVLTGHSYKAGRAAGLRPVIFEQDSSDSFYIAVAPRNISLVDLQEAEIEVDQSNHQAFHAAAFFNLQRNHDICRKFENAALGATIRIVNSAEYMPNDDDILICSNLSVADSDSDYSKCNMDAQLQRAVFVSPILPRRVVIDMKRRLFDVIIKRYGLEGENVKSFNFFGEFQGKQNVIFKNSTISFDLEPTYRNGVTEQIFNRLHCNTEDHQHDPSQLE